jgi:hypothetical protein
LAILPGRYTDRRSDKASRDHRGKHIAASHQPKLAALWPIERVLIAHGDAVGTAGTAFGRGAFVWLLGLDKRSQLRARYFLAA